MPSNKPSRKPIGRMYDIYKPYVDSEYHIHAVEVIEESKQYKGYLSIKYIDDRSGSPRCDTNRWRDRESLYATYQEAKAAIINLQYDVIRIATEDLRQAISKLNRIMEYTEEQ